MTDLDRVAPQCEMRDCPNRADYFWHWQVRPIVSWIPVCAPCIAILAEDLSESYPALPVAPIAESALRVYRGSEVAA